MDKQKKQIMLVAVLAVVALGAGGYFVMTRERVDPNRGRATTTGPVQRKVREQAETKKTETKRRVAKTKKTPATEATASRKVRKDTGKKTAKRRSKRRGEGTKVKKKEIKPAA